MKTIDLLVSASWIIPIRPEGQVLTDHAIAIDDGKIVELLPADKAAGRYQPREQKHLDQQVLMPGFINAHTHAAMSLFKGLADDLPLMLWLQNHIWPAEKRWVNEEFVRDGSRLAMAEMIRGGTTCFNDMYFLPQVTAREAVDAGMRAGIGFVVLEFPSTWATGAEDYIHQGLQVFDDFKHQETLSFSFAPHAPYTVEDKSLERIRTYADELGLGIHMHVHETDQEIREAVAKNGKRPLYRLQDLGLLTPQLQAVHMTHLTDKEIALVKSSGVSVIHCPQSNMKLASGICPTARLLEAGARLAIGTDGNASNNDLDMFGEIKSAAFLAKVVSGSATALPAHKVLSLATLGGARAMGIDQLTGSLEPGKAADLIAVDLGAIETQPVYHPPSQLAYAAGREQVSHVWVNGRLLLDARRLTTIDENDLLETARAWRQRIAKA